VALSGPATTALTVALVAGLGGAAYFAVSQSKRTVTCPSTIEGPGGPLSAQMIFHIDFERALMSSNDGDRPVTVTSDSVKWTHAKKTPDGRSQVTEVGDINRRTGVFLMQRKLLASNGAVDETQIRGRCSGAE